MTTLLLFLTIISIFSVHGNALFIIHNNNNQNMIWLFRQCMWRGQSTKKKIIISVTKRRNYSYRSRLASVAGQSQNSSTDIHSFSSSATSIAIIGGGLAGLSTAYHLLDIIASNTAMKRDTSTSKRCVQKITIFDTAHVGEGGASSVAGGLIHPFSPRGKLIHFGLPALEQANYLISIASKSQPTCVLRPRLYRIALSHPNNSEILQSTAKQYPNLATWMTKDDVYAKLDIHNSLGGLELGGGCKVIHVPTYLKGLWEECETKARSINGKIEWKLVPSISKQHSSTNNKNNNISESTTSCHAWKDTEMMNRQLDTFDAVILSAGAGIVHDNLVSEGGINILPAQLVRGQSIEMALSPDASYSGKKSSREALLCGKYVSPLLPSDDYLSQRWVIGATHEFNDIPSSTKEVRDELAHHTYDMARHLWDNGTVTRITSGVRLQSRRGKFGRMPMIGRYVGRDSYGVNHRNSWLFTGLSSRGLIYHGLFGRWLAQAVLNNNEEELRECFDDFDWWKKNNIVSIKI